MTEGPNYPAYRRARIRAAVSSPGERIFPEMPDASEFVPKSRILKGLRIFESIENDLELRNEIIDGKRYFIYDGMDPHHLEDEFFPTIVNAFNEIRAPYDDAILRARSEEHEFARTLQFVLFSKVLAGYMEGSTSPEYLKFVEEYVEPKYEEYRAKAEEKARRDKRQGVEVLGTEAEQEQLSSDDRTD